MYQTNKCYHKPPETLRISPPGFQIYKVCAESCQLNDYAGQSVTVEEGTVVQIPMYSIHNDPLYYPNPRVFDPNRFDPVHGRDPKALRDLGLFAPFGMGPRICIGMWQIHSNYRWLNFYLLFFGFIFCAGMRFSTLQIKTAIVEIVRNFQITVNDRTPDPLIVMPENYLYLPVHNIFLDYAPL